MSRITRLTGLMASAALSCQTPRPDAASPDPLKETHADRVSTVAGEVDRVVDAAYAKEGIVPAGHTDDAHFVRRVYLDVVGTIPAPETVTAFLADTSSDKRSKLVEALLRDPRYGEHWSQYWEALLLGRKFREQIVDRRTFRTYLKSRFDANTAWNTVAYELIDAQGQNSFGALTPEMAAPEAPADTAPGMGTMMAASGSNSMAAPEMSSGTSAATAGKGSVNGAVNWLLRFDKNPADLAGTVSKLFLGMQIQCAQCHDHPTEKWKQQDFRRFAACFTRTKVQQIDKGKVIGPRRVAVEDVNHTVKQGVNKNPDLRDYLFARPTALDGTDLSAAPFPRAALASWITDRSNPWFSKALVNRLWGHFLGRGIVDPVDDLRDSNPPASPEVLQLLADDFAASGFDLRHEIRLITATEAYQRDSTPLAQPSARADALWARFHVRPLGPEELLNAVVEATHLQPILQEVAGDDLERLRDKLEQQFVFLFDVDEESEQFDFEGTIPQALFLLNGQMINAGASGVTGAALSEVLTGPGGDDQKVASLYLRTLSRPPTNDELQFWTKFVNDPREVAKTGKGPPALKVADAAPEGKPRKPAAPDPLARLNRRLTQPGQTPRLQAYEDMLWTLLNSSEFNFNH